MPRHDLLSPLETSFVSGAPLKEVYKVARERLPTALIVRTRRKVMFKPAAALCVRIDHDLPKDVPVSVRRAFYRALRDQPAARTLTHGSGLLTYVIDTSKIAEEISHDLAAYRRAMDLVQENPELQAGAATFKTTRILVHTIADLLKAGATHRELQQDYPNLTPAMLEAAPIYAHVHPRRGRPRRPEWGAQAGDGRPSP